MIKLLLKNYLILFQRQLILLTRHFRGAARFETNLAEPDNVSIMRSSTFGKRSKLGSTRALKL